jgi:hydrogenase maturation protease
MNAEPTKRKRERQILVAGVGNAWLKDDGFGGEVVKRLDERALPSGVVVLDFGTGGLDLAYEVMRGYDALVLVDVSRQGGEPGSLYLVEPDPDEIESGLEDGEVINPHGMDPQTVLRFVRSVHGWPGKVIVVACEPATVEEMGMGLSPEVEAVVARAVDVVIEQINLLKDDAAYEQPAGERK